MRYGLLPLAAVAVLAAQPMSPAEAAIKATLQNGQTMLVGDVLPSSSRQYYAELKPDGNLIIYRGSAPFDNQGTLWESAKAGGYATQPGAYYLIMQGDGRLAIHRGTGPGDEHGLVWASHGDGGGHHFAILQDSGVLAVFHGSRPADNSGMVWSSDQSGGQ